MVVASVVVEVVAVVVASGVVEVAAVATVEVVVATERSKIKLPVYEKRI